MTRRIQIFYFIWTNNRSQNFINKLENPDSNMQPYLTNWWLQHGKLQIIKNYFINKRSQYKLMIPVNSNVPKKKRTDFWAIISTNWIKSTKYASTTRDYGDQYKENKKIRWNKFKKCSSSLKHLTWSEICACLKDRLTGTKEKPVITLDFHVVLKGPAFIWLLAGKACVHPVPDL